MTTRTKVVLFTLGLFTLAALGVGFVIWPNYAESKRLNNQITNLYARMNSFARQAEKVDALAREVRQLERQIKAELKVIPESPDAELLIGKLSLPIDGRTIQDQTFTTGQAGPAVGRGVHAAGVHAAGRGVLPLAAEAPGTDIAAQALPLSVEMQAQFEAVFATLRLAETMDRLVRVTSVRVERDPQARAKEEDWVNQPLLLATIGLDAVFEPPRALTTGATAPTSRSGTDAAGGQAQETATP